MGLSQKKIDKIFKDIHAGRIDIDNLPYELSQFTYDEIIKFVQSGFGELSSTGKIARMTNYESNITAFSGAKTFQEVKDLNNFIFTEEGAKRSFSEFKGFAKSIDNQYNNTWLKVEQDTAFSTAQGADKWMDFEEDIDTFPMLKYQTALDERVRLEHAAWDNIVRHVNDSFWDTRMPPNGWNCRCNVIKLSEGRNTNLKTHLSDFNKNNPDKKVSSLENKSEMFNKNPGKVEYIFNEKKHPYFKHTKAEGPAFERSLKWQSPSRLTSKGVQLEDLPKKNIDAIKSYTTGKHTPINNVLRTGESGNRFDKTKDMLAIASDIDSGLSTAEKFKGRVYRGVRLNKKEFDSFTEGLKKGGILTDKAFMSTTLDKKIASEFGTEYANQGIILDIKATGKNGVDISKISHVKDEKEILFNRESKFRISDIVKDKSNNKEFWTIKLEEL